MDISFRVCRICLDPEGDDHHFVSAFKNEGETADRIQFYCDVSVFEDKDPVVCNNCLKTINNMHQLREECLNADENYFQVLRKEDATTNTPVQDATKPEKKTERKLVDKKEILGQPKDQKLNKKLPNNLPVVHSKTESKRRYPRNGYYHCDLCPKIFLKSKNLRTHKETHSDIRKYKCSQCGKAFKQVCGLYGHCRVVHKTGTTRAY